MPTYRYEHSEENGCRNKNCLLRATDNRHQIYPQNETRQTYIVRATIFV